MSSISPQQPDPCGSFSDENAPQVVVRAGKTYLCSACGTLVQVPADVVGQLVLAVGQSPQSDNVSNETASEEPAPAEPPVEVPGSEKSARDKQPAFNLPASEASANSTERTSVPSPRTARKRQVAAYDSPHLSRPNRPGSHGPRRPKQPQRNTFVGQMIDGLKVPSAAELDRALAWVSFHLKVLDRQGAEVKRLEKLLKKRRQSKSRVPQKRPSTSHARADINMAPASDSMHQRGPP